MQKMGLPEQWAFSEIYGFEEDLLAMLPQPVIAVVIAAHRLKKAEDKELGSADTEADFYMRQTGKLDNACGVIACLHAIYNNKSSIVIQSDSTLGKYLQNCEGKSSLEKAVVLENFKEF